MLNKEALLLGLGGEKEDLFFQWIERTLTSFVDIDLHITAVGSGAFAGCSSLARVSLPHATSVAGNAFSECDALVSVDLPVCESVGGRAFRKCSALISISLPKCTSFANEYVFQECAALTAIHFAAANEAKMEACAGYSTKWGAVNATVYFDL